MSAAASGEQCQAADRHCVTCGDEGIPMRVMSAAGGQAICSDAEHELHDVAIELVGPVAAGDGVLVHAGVAIGRIEGAP